MLRAYKYRTGIYKITSPNGRVYIGKSTNIKRRWEKYKCLSCKDQPRLYNSFVAHGVSEHTFEVIEICNEYQLNEREIFYIKLFDSFNTINGLNLSSGGDGGRLSDETKIRISDKMKLLPRSQEAIERLLLHRGVNGMLGKKHSEIARQRMRKPRGKNKKIKTLSPEHRIKIAEANRARIYTDVMKKNYSDAAKKRQAKNNAGSIRSNETENYNLTNVATTAIKE